MANKNLELLRQAEQLLGQVEFDFESYFEEEVTDIAEHLASFINDLEECDNER